MTCGTGRKWDEIGTERQCLWTISYRDNGTIYDTQKICGKVMEKSD